MPRCTGNQSASYFRSFLDSNMTATPEIPVYSIDAKAGLRKRYDKRCLADCFIDK
jgi:hypothetical protein